MEDRTVQPTLTGELPLPRVTQPCDPFDDVRGNLSEYYSVATRIHETGHTCTALLRLEPRTRQMTVEEMGCYHVATPSRWQALLSLRYAIETAISEYQREHSASL